MTRLFRIFKNPGWLLALLMTAHGILVMDAIRRQSPAWDEIILPAAGLAQWRTGQIAINQDHPFLSKLIVSFPLLWTSDSLPFDHASWREKDSSRFGFQFTFRGRTDPKKIIFWTRIPSLILSLGMCFFLFRWVRSIWGPLGGFAGVLCLSLSPILLSRASLALLEMPLTFFLTMTLIFWAQWRRSQRLLFYFSGAVAAGCAMTCKSAAAPFLVGLALAEFSASHPYRSFIGRVQSTLGLLLVALLTVLLLYLPWEGGWSALKIAWLFPLRFGGSHNHFYFAGTLYTNASPLLSWVALLLKAPLFVWALALWGCVLWYRSGVTRDIWWGLLLISAITLFSVFGAGTALSTIQLSPLYIVLAAFASGIAATKWHSKTIMLSLLLFLGAGVEIANAHPNQLAFFNFLAGGPALGYKWLADSDQDWGQSLPELARYVTKEGNPGVILCYSGSADPEAYDLKYQDLLSPALVSRERKNRLLPLEEKKIYLAISTKVLQIEPDAMRWLVGPLPPKKLVDSCFFVYDISKTPDVFLRMAHLYRQTGRNIEAHWCEEKAKGLGTDIIPASPMGQKH